MKKRTPPAPFTPTVVPFTPAPDRGPRHFAWGDESTFIAEQKPVAAYFNMRDDLIIRQQDNEHLENDSVVVIRPEHLDGFAHKLFDLLGYSRGGRSA